MKTAIFNIHDVAVFLLALECAMLALLFSVYRSVNAGRLLLALFLFFNALIALDNLIFWSEEVRHRMFDAFPDIFFLLGLVVFLEGPILYWFTRSVTGGKIPFRPAEAWHLLPAVAVLFYLYFVYYRHPLHIQRELVLEFGIFEAPGIYFSLVVIVYGALCLHRLKSSHSNGGPAFAWLRLLIMGFLLIWIWAFLAHLVGMHTSGVVSDMMGISVNYLILILVNILLFYSFIHPEIIANLGTEAGSIKSGGV
jgi:hypothetical protein